MLRHTRPVQIALQILLRPKKERTAKDEAHLHHLLENDDLYREVKEKYGDDGIHTFVRGLMLRGEGEPVSRLGNLFWLYVLVGNVTVRGGRYNAGQSLLLGEQPPEVCVHPGTILLAIDRDRMAKIEDNHQQARLYGGIRQLRKVAFFSGMETKELQALYSQCERQAFTRNGYVQRQGQLATHLFIIISGTFVMRKEVPADQDTSFNGLQTTRSQSKKYRNIVLMTELEIFGEESMHLDLNAEQPVATETYCSEVVCDSSEGVLLRLPYNSLMNYPLKRYLSLPDRIYYFYESRRQKAKNLFNVATEDEISRTEQQQHLEKYLEKIYQRPGKINSSYVHIKREYIPDVRFYRKQELSSMKLRLKYQNVLDKVDQLKTLSQKTLRVPNYNKPKRMYNRNADIEMKLLLREFNRTRDESRAKGDDAISAMLIKSQSQFIHSDRNMTITPKPRPFSKRTEETPTPRTKRLVSSTVRMKHDSPAKRNQSQINFLTTRRR